MTPSQAAPGGVHRGTEQRWVDPVVVSVQSRVAMGHVGNSAAVLPLQVAGFEVVDVPTTLLSNHPFYPSCAGAALPAAVVADLLAGIAERGVGAAARAVISGYLATTGVAPAVGDFVVAARGVNPDLRYVCDPVLGDDGPGLYVEPGLVGEHRSRLVPLADVVTPNLFELGLLTEPGASSVADVVARSGTLLGRRDAAVVTTGAALSDTLDGFLDTVVVAGPPGSRGTWRIRAARVDRHFDGTGDVFTALFAAAWLRGPAGTGDVAGAVAAAVAGTGVVVRATVVAGTKELRTVASVAEALRAPPAGLERLD